MKTLIIENELAAQELLHTILQKYISDIHVVGFSSTIEEAIPKINQACPDILFLDIELDDGQSFEILDKINCPETKIIFTTAYDDYAIKAFEYNAIDYLLKPYTPQRVQQAISKAKKIIENESVFSKLNDYISNKSQPRKNISISCEEGLKIVTIDDILRVEADKSYCTIFLETGKKISSSKPLSDIEARLDPNQFFRTHKSHLINLHKIKELSHRDGGEVILKNEDRIPVSRRKKSELLAILRA